MHGSVNSYHYKYFTLLIRFTYLDVSIARIHVLQCDSAAELQSLVGVFNEHFSCC